MANLWERMNHIYGHKWSSAFGVSATDKDMRMTDAAQTWANGLIGITGPQIAIGFRACIARDEPWPPTLPEFRALCLPVKRDPIHRDYVALPRPPHDPEKIDSALQSMRSALK